MGILPRRKEKSSTAVKAKDNIVEARGRTAKAKASRAEAKAKKEDAKAASAHNRAKIQAEHGMMHGINVNTKNGLSVGFWNLGRGKRRK